MAEQLTRKEAVEFLTMQQDLFADAKEANELAKCLEIIEQAGDKVGYAPAFRCLVKGLEPEESIRWGK